MARFGASKEGLMGADSARRWIIISGFGLTVGLVLFLWFAPNFHYPLRPPEAQGLLQIALPVFIGNLSSASAYAFKYRDADNTPLNPLAGYFIKGGTIVFAILATALFVNFALANQSDASAMTLDMLKTYLIAVLSILTASTGIAVSTLFPKAQ
jgi:RsiW-degrading membrane proteinase PrsW (M82 family)